MENPSPSQLPVSGRHTALLAVQVGLPWPATCHSPFGWRLVWLAAILY